MKKVALTIICCLLVFPALHARQMPNIVVFLADDLGWTDLGCYGSSFYETPNIDKLAESGIRFTSAYAACNVCSPTRAALMTGKYPARLHITDWITGYKKPDAKLLPPDWTQYLPLEEITIAELLKKKGYVTASVGKWHLGEMEQYWPENQGFDVNIGGWSKGSPNRNQKQNTNGYFSPYGNPRLQDGPDGEHLTGRLTDEAIGFIKNNKDKPFFLYMPYYAVHTPLQAKEEDIAYFTAKVDKNAPQQNPVYASMVRYLDQSVGRVLEALRKLDLEENTLVVFTSDNGGLLGKNNPITSNLPLRAGKGTAHEGGTRTPAIFSWKGKIRPGRLSHDPVITMDIFSTLAAVAGIPERRLGLRDGISLLPALLDDEKLNRPDALYWHYPHYHNMGATPHSSIRKGNMKLIYFYEDGKKELYDLHSDPGETNDLYAKKSGEGEALFTQLQEWLESVKAQEPVVNPGYRE